jgi:hypothetical protein
MRVLGVDLGQAHDYTAIALIEAHRGPSYNLTLLERPELKTSYPRIVQRVVEMMKKLKGLVPDEHCQLVVDATGVGRPVVDLMRERGLAPIPVTITGGSTELHEDWCYRVPKRNLVSNAQVLLQQRQLKVAGDLPLGPLLIKELEAFKVKIDPLTAHDSYSAGREGIHDDLVMGVALALWWAEKFAAPFEPPKPKPGTPEWFEAQEEEHIKRLQARQREENDWGWSY